jgi:hypothetical protein
MPYRHTCLTEESSKRYVFFTMVLHGFENTNNTNQKPQPTTHKQQPTRKNNKPVSHASAPKAPYTAQYSRKFDFTPIPLLLFLL